MIKFASCRRVESASKLYNTKITFFLGIFYIHLKKYNTVIKSMIKISINN